MKPMTSIGQMGMVLVTLAISGCSDFAGDSGSLDTGVALERAIFNDLPYAEIADSQVLDLYVPAGAGPHPVIVLVHGGGFFTGDKRVHQDDAAYLVEQGFAAASINYRLSGEATFPAAVQDCKAAVRFLRANADVYRIDPDRIGSWGESAGGNLAAMLGTSAGDVGLEGEALGNAGFASDVTATVTMFPPIDFLTIDEQAAALGFTTNTDDAGSFESAYMGFAVQSDPEQTARANPTTYIDADDAAFLVQAGDADELMPYTQSENFYDALRAELGDERTHFDLFEGAGHGGADFDSEENLEKIVSFFQAHL
ncbi:MAG: alpha/beta hydrolase [Myxococcota bacterium]